MARRDRTADALRQIAAWRRGEESPSDDDVRAALDHTSGAVAAAAAEYVATQDPRVWQPRLEDALGRLLDSGAERDANCRAKTAILHALTEWEAPCTALYQRAVRYKQEEPVYGGATDTAGTVRALALVGLVRTLDPSAWAAAADLLADPETEARGGAIAAAAELGGPAGAALLRYHVRRGEDDLDALQEALRLLFELDPTALALGDEMARHPHPQVATTAIIALGESKVPGALPILENLCADHRPPAAAVYLALLLHRSDDALAILCDRVRTGTPEHARCAVEAAAPHLTLPSIASAIEAAVTDRDDARLHAAFDRLRPR